MSLTDAIVHERNEYLEVTKRIAEVLEMQAAIVRDKTIHPRTCADELDRLNERISMHLHLRTQSYNRLRVMEDTAKRTAA